MIIHENAEFTNPSRTRHSAGSNSLSNPDSIRARGHPIVGSEETYITLAKLPTMSAISGIPYLPITLTFPWLGLLGVLPLPARFYIDIGEPICMDGCAPEAAQDMVAVIQLTDQVRNTVQEMIRERLSQGRSVFFG